MLRHCIPSFRLPVDVIDFEAEFIKKLGVKFSLGKKITDPKSLLSQGFEAVFIGAGLPRSKSADFTNSEISGVYQATEFLKDVKHGTMPDLGKRVLVIGGGDTAIDAARTARLAGAESFIVYRRTQKEMPAYQNEIEAAWHEGVEFYFRVLPRSVVGDKSVKGLKCVRVKWHDKISGMPQGYDVEGTEFTIACDTIITAIGQSPESTFGLRTSPSGLIGVEKNTFKTSIEGIFAAGDIVDGGGTAAKAVGMGKLAAMQMDVYLLTR
jgi:NADPH-dependent glutamate synthase beta subunit-like oxidoreductase